MLNTIRVFEETIYNWPDNKKLDVTQLAEKMNLELPRLASYLHDGLSKPIDIYENMSRKEIELAFENLKRKWAPRILAAEKSLNERKSSAQRGYELVLKKVSKLSIEKKWYNAYRTVAYFIGNYHELLNFDSKVGLHNEALRLGFKSEAHFQELAQFLKDAMGLFVEEKCPDALEEGFDFIETFADDFVSVYGRNGDELINECSKILARPLESITMVKPTFSTDNATI